MSDNGDAEPRFLDLRGSLAALNRAALRAREEAIRTHTNLVMVRDGKMVIFSPADEPEILEGPVDPDDADES